MILTFYFHSARATDVLDDLDALAQRCGERNFHALHVGRTTFAPHIALTDLADEDMLPAAHEYASPKGLAALRRNICTYQRDMFNLEFDVEQVLVTAGATHALSCAVSSIVCPDDEIIVLSPHWLFAVGVIESCGARAVEAPVFLELGRNAQFEFIAALDSRLSSRTKAIYYNTPNNPSGYSFTRAQLGALARFSEEHDLWLLADNVYEAFDFSEDGFLNIAALAPARTLSIHSFSKTFSMSGFRVGYLIAPTGHVDAVRKCGLYSVYSVSTLSQHAACRALAVPLQRTQEQCHQVRAASNLVARDLKIPGGAVTGGFYRLLDLSHLSQRQYDDFMSRCIEAGVSLTPGTVFGRCCANYARMCFTAVAIDQLRSAITILNHVHAKILSE